MAYRVYYNTEGIGCPGEMERWLNEICEMEHLELVGVDNGYYIFKTAQ